MPIREADPRHSSRSSRVIRAGPIPREASVGPGSSRSMRTRDHFTLGIAQNGSLGDREARGRGSARQRFNAD